MFPAKIGLTLLLLGLSFPVLPEAVDRLVDLANEAHGHARGRGVSGMSEEKTEKPTAKKRKESRKEGQVPRTQELGGWASLLLVGHGAAVLLGRELTALRELMASCFTAAGGRRPPRWRRCTLLGEGAEPRAHDAGACSARACMVVGVAAALAQGGFYLATKARQAEVVQARTRSRAPSASSARRPCGRARRCCSRAPSSASWRYGAIKAMMPLLGGLVPDPGRARAWSPTRSLGADPQRRHRGPGDGRRRLRVPAPPDRQADPDDQARGQAGAQADRGRPADQERDPLPPARRRPQPDDGRRRRPPTWCWSTRRTSPWRCATTPSAAAHPGSSPGAPARSRARSASEADEHRVPLVRDVPAGPGAAPLDQVGQEIPPELFAAVAQVLAFVISRRSRGQPRRRAPQPARPSSELPAVRRPPDDAAGARRQHRSLGLAGR